MALEAKISSKLRFEVFKRDSFTCQDCGQTLPDVVLYVGYKIAPEDGGKPVLLNLITRCYDCSAKEPTDVLSRKREQLELIIEWKKSQQHFEEDSTDLVVAYINSKMDKYSLKKKAEKEVSKALKKYGFVAVMECIDTAAEKTINYDDNGFATHESVEDFIANIHKFLFINSLPKSIQRARYVAGICRNKYGPDCWEDAKDLMEKYVKALQDHDYDEDMIEKDINEEVIPETKRKDSWDAWSRFISKWISDINGWGKDKEESGFVRKSYSRDQVESFVDIDIWHIDAYKSIIMTLFRSSSMYSEEKEAELEQSLGRMVYYFLEDLRALYVKLKTVPDRNDKTLVENHSIYVEGYDYFCPEDILKYKEKEYNGIAEQYIAENLLYHLTETMLDLLFFPQTHYDFKSALCAMDLLLKRYEKYDVSY